MSRVNPEQGWWEHGPPVGDDRLRGVPSDPPDTFWQRLAEQAFKERDLALCDSIAAQEAEAQAIRERDVARAALRTNALMRHVEQHKQFPEWATCPVVTCGDARRALGESA